MIWFMLYKDYSCYWLGSGLAGVAGMETRHSQLGADYDNPGDR